MGCNPETAGRLSRRGREARPPARQGQLKIPVPQNFSAYLTSFSKFGLLAYRLAWSPPQQSNRALPKKFNLNGIFFDVNNDFVNIVNNDFVDNIPDSNFSLDINTLMHVLHVLPGEF